MVAAILITNLATQTTDMLMPQQHMYMEFNADQAAMAHRPGMAPSIKPFRDPSNPCAYDEGSTCKNLGVEQVNGRSCDHWQVTDKNGKVSQRLDRPEAALPYQVGDRRFNLGADEY